MHCMKCGQESEGSQVFCRNCLAEMEKYPVKPGTPVYIPSRSHAIRKAPRHIPTAEPEEQLHRLRGRLRWLTACLIMSLMALAAAAALILYLYRQPDDPFTTGQDYSVSDTDTVTTSTNGRRIR